MKKIKYLVLSFVLSFMMAFSALAEPNLAMIHSMTETKINGKDQEIDKKTEETAFIEENAAAEETTASDIPDYEEETTDSSTEPGADGPSSPVVTNEEAEASSEDMENESDTEDASEDEEAESGNETTPESGNEATQESSNETEPESGAEFASESESETENESQSEIESDTQSETESESQSETESESETETTEDTPDEFHEIKITFITDNSTVSNREVVVTSKEGEVITLTNILYPPYCDFYGSGMRPELEFCYNNETIKSTDFEVFGYSLIFTLTEKSVTEITITVIPNALIDSYPSSVYNIMWDRGVNNELVGISSMSLVIRTGMNAWWPKDWEYANDMVTRSSDWSYFMTSSMADLKAGDIILWYDDLYGLYQNHIAIIISVADDHSHFYTADGNSYRSNGSATGVRINKHTDLSHVGSQSGEPLLVWRNSATYTYNGITVNVADLIAYHAEDMSRYVIETNDMRYNDAWLYQNVGWCFAYVCEELATTEALGEIQFSAETKCVGDNAVSMLGAIYDVYLENDKKSNVSVIFNKNGTGFLADKYDNSKYVIEANLSGFSDYINKDVYSNILVYDKKGNLIDSYKWGRLVNNTWYCNSGKKIKVPAGNYIIKQLLPAANYKYADDSQKHKLSVRADEYNYEINLTPDLYEGDVLFHLLALDAEIKIDRTTADIGINRSINLVATVTPVEAASALTWKSENEKVAVVDENGKVTGIGRGTAKITAAINGIKKVTCKVTVEFNDVLSLNSTFKTAINWAADNGIAQGYSNGKFGESDVCTRKQFVVMLYRAAGRPKVSGSVKFTDCIGFSGDSSRAIIWATQNGIIKGFADGTFRPDASVTRKQVMVMLYRFAGKPDVSGTLPFIDVTADADSDTYRSIMWGSSVGITNGTSETTFNPNGSCLRRHIAMFLYKFYNL